ncbi:substrate-binding periplasmic protein [Psychromonas sp. KJ10-10]|uniref:substrate-binding periplasmic protein n=1 Tax=Psychromonas sp. KJ10-10 TaxID=3391823 RepID=UPI0039B63E94
MKLSLFFLYVFWLFLFSVNAQAERFTFAVAENEAPLSYQQEGIVTGIIPEIITLIFSYLPRHQVTLKSYPWSRAQVQVEYDKADGFLTYPSKRRKQYSHFTSSHAYKLDFGFLIYHKNNTNRSIIESANSFEDLGNLKIITQKGAEWESDNIPEFMQKLEANNLYTMLHWLLRREQGDFLIAIPEQAKYLAKKFGYQHLIAYRHVDFINDSQIPFHLGVRQSHPFARELTEEVDVVLKNEVFRKQVQDIVARYR